MKKELTRKNVQCGVNREAVKISALSLDKIDKYEEKDSKNELFLLIPY